MDPATASGNRRRTRLAPDLRRERIIEAATELFERHPFDELTTARLAAECRVSEGLLFHYFGSKRGLYVACLERSIEAFLASIEDPGPEHPLRERFRWALDSYLDFVETYPRSYAAVLRGGIGMDGEVHELIELARERFCTMIVRGLGVKRPSPRLLLATWGWMGFVEASCTRWLARREIERAELRDLLLEFAFDTVGRLAAEQQATIA